MASAIDSAPAEAAAAPDSPSGWRRWSARLAARLFLAHIVLLAPLVVALLALARQSTGAPGPEAVAERARLLAAALADDGAALEEEARFVLRHAGPQSGRLRVLDRRGAVLADSLEGGPEPEPALPAVSIAILSGGLEVGSVVGFQPPRSPWAISTPVAAALAAAALVWAAFWSRYLSRRIARPLEILRRETAQLLDHHGRVRVRPGEPRFTAALRPDEIGDLARALDEMSQRLDRHLQQSATFAADLAHEIKNPLAGIRSAAEVLGEVHDPVERRRFAGIVEAESARLDALLHAARESTVLDAQLAAEERLPVALEPLLAELVATARLGTATPIEFAAAPGAAGLVVLARADRLAQVIGNLLDNLISFSPPGAPIKVALTPTHDGALVHLRDRGPGIPPEHLERIFERFFSYRPARPARPASPTGPGTLSQGAGEEVGRGGGHTGTGLAIARTIVTAYGGTLRAENAVDGGARFELRLPRASVADLALRAPGSAPAQR